jgi:hypothetical protein
MVFNAIESAVNSLTRYYSNSVWINLLVGIGYGGLILVNIYLKSGLNTFIVFTILMIIVFYRITISRIIKQSKILNHFASSIDVDGFEISLSTIRVNAFLGLIKREPIPLKIANEKIRIRKAEDNYGNPKYNGKVFLLMYGTDEFAIAEKFFEDFESLIHEIENYEQLQNENSI